MRILGFWNEEREGTQEAGGRRCGDVITVHRAMALREEGKWNVHVLLEGIQLEKRKAGYVRWWSLRFLFYPLDYLTGARRASIMQFIRPRLSADTDLSQVSSASSPTEDKTAGKQDFPSPKSSWRIESKQGAPACV